MLDSASVQLALSPHPATPPAKPDFQLWADVAHTHLLGRTGGLTVWFCVGAPLARFVAPAPGEGARTDGLWQSTCFEIFLQPEGSSSYQEWNFATSGDWAAYAFADYRRESADLDVGSAPDVRVQDNLRWWQLGVTVPIATEHAWRMGLSAVLEESDGTRSYWALAHAGAKPDFHHADCFAARLP